MSLIISQYVTDENFPSCLVRDDLMVVTLRDIGLSPTKYVYFGEILEAMARMKLMAGTMSDLLHYSLDWDCTTQVIALGSLWKAGFGDYFAGSLCKGPDGPELTLRDADFGWTQDDHFLVARS